MTIISQDFEFFTLTKCSKAIIMIEHEFTFRVQYPDTDQMGTVHHSNYAKFYETARWELFRSIGIPYRDLEEVGFMLPVTRMNLHFLRTTHYDEQLTVITTLTNIKAARIWFTYKLYNEQHQLIGKAETELAFVNRNSWKPCLPPVFVLHAIERARTQVTATV